MFIGNMTPSGRRDIKGPGSSAPLLGTPRKEAGVPRARGVGAGVERLPMGTQLPVGDGNVLEPDGVKVAQHCECAKHH